MTFRRLSMARARGFTLIEILVVLVILGIVVGVVALKPTSFFLQRRITFEAERLQFVLAQARVDAIVNGRVLGVRFEVHGYRWFVLDEKGQWNSIQRESLYAPRKLDASMVLSVSQTTQPSESEDKTNLESDESADHDEEEEEHQEAETESNESRPQLVIFNDFQMTPFRAQFRDRQNRYPPTYVIGDGVGLVKTFRQRAE